MPSWHSGGLVNRNKNNLVHYGLQTSSSIYCITEVSLQGRGLDEYSVILLPAMQLISRIIPKSGITETAGAIIRQKTWTETSSTSKEKKSAVIVILQVHTKAINFWVYSTPEKSLWKSWKQAAADGDRQRVKRGCVSPWSWSWGWRDSRGGASPSLSPSLPQTGTKN